MFNDATYILYILLNIIYNTTQDGWQEHVA
jgi:hypothetical protein